MKKKQTILAILCAAALLSANLPAALAGREATPTDLQEQTGNRTEELVVNAETTAEDDDNTIPEQELPDAGNADDNTIPEQELPDAGNADDNTIPEQEQPDTGYIDDNTIPEQEQPDTGNADDNTIPEQELLDAGYVEVMIIREQGTNLYFGMDEHSSIAGTLEQEEEVWAKPQGSFWAEILKEDPKDKPMYFNLNNAALLLGEIGYDLPIRKVTLKSTLEGMTEVLEGTEVTLTAKYKGFQGDEITEIRWQYRPEDDPDGEFRDIEGADGFTYTYQVNEENIHHEWRIILILKP